MSVLGTLLQFKNTILFYSFIGLLVYINRDKFYKLGTLVYVLRTKIGLKLMNSWAKKYRSFIKFLGYIGIVFGYIGFFGIFYLLIQEALKILAKKPDAMGGGPVLPGLPIAGTGLVFPLIIGWISLFIIMIVHEFSHGVVARAHNIKVKASGLAFFGPILGAFVEPDDKDLHNHNDKAQLSVFAAGPFSNIILWGVCTLLLISLYPSDGIVIKVMQNESMPAYISGIPENLAIK